MVITWPLVLVSLSLFSSSPSSSSSLLESRSEDLGGLVGLDALASKGLQALKKDTSNSWFARTWRLTSVDRPPTWGKLKIILL